jgi:hypothetical protein
VLGLRSILAICVPLWALAPASEATASVSRLAIPLPEDSARLALAAAAEPAPVAGADGELKPRGSDIWRAAVVPGWGQWRAGHREVGLVFLTIDAAAWATMFASIGQGHLRRGSSEETALRYAGIDLTQVDDDFRKRTSDFISSDEYNRLVVMRDAASLYYGDFDNYNRYIEENSLQGAEAWTWESEESWERYRRERRTSESAFQRARYAGAVLVANRVASTIVAARLKPKTSAAQASAPPAPPRTQVLWGVGTSAGGSIEPRLVCVYRF